MVCRDFPGRGPLSCKHSVNGLCCRFRVSDEGVGQRWRRRRMHRRCIGCEEDTRPTPRAAALREFDRDDEAPTTQQPPEILSLVWPGLHLPSRPYGVREHGAQGRGRAGRCAALDTSCTVSRPRLARPRTVAPLREAVPILGMVLCESHFLAAAGVTRMGGNRASGFRRAAVFGRAIARDPSPRGEGAPPKGRSKIRRFAPGMERLLGFRSAPSSWSGLAGAGPAESCRFYCGSRLP